MKFCASTVDITPTEPINLVGYGPELRVSTGVRYPLEANILLVDAKLVIVSVDALYLGSDFISAIKAKIPRSLHAFFVASHTHFAPSLDGSKPNLGETNNDWLDRVADLISANIISLAEAISWPGRTFYGHDQCDANIYRRRRSFLKRKFPHLTWRVGLLPDRRRDIPKTLQIAAIKRHDGTTGAIIWSWPCHPVEFLNARHVSSAFPGAVRRALRAYLDDHTVPVLYMPGFCGDIRPAITKSYLGFEAFKNPDEEDISRFERTIEQSAIKALRSSSSVEDDDPLIRDRSVPLRDVGLIGTSDIEVTHLSLGELAITGIGAEVCSGYLGPMGFDPLKPHFFTGCYGPTFGYLPTDKQIKEGGYEVWEFMPFFSVSGAWKSGVAPTIIDAVRRARMEYKYQSDARQDTVRSPLASQLPPPAG